MRFTILIFFITFSFSQNLEEIKKDYLKSTNSWINTYKNRKEFFNLEDKILKLENELKIKQNRSKRDKLEILKEKLKLYEKLNIEFITLMKLPLNDIKINLFTYLTDTYFREFKKQKERYLNLKREYNFALTYLNDTLNRVKEIDTNEAREFEKEIKEDINYFLLTKELFDRQLKNLHLYEEEIIKKSRVYEEETLKQHYISIIFITIIFLIGFILKKLLTLFNKNLDEDDIFIYNKTISVVIFSVIIIFLLFTYIQNILHALTIIGIIAAALTIVLKEFILNLFGWFYITMSSFIKVGDRILIFHENQPIIGDIINISLTKITLYESINYTSAMELKRAGRVVFVPNNYVFNHSIFNYTHSKMKTIYDLIEIDLEYKSNVEKANDIVLSIVESKTSRYQDMAKLQYQYLKKRYEIRHMSLNPRVQFIINPDHDGYRMYLWYIAPYREILNLRSAVTVEIIEAFKKEEDIYLREKKS